jgi:hypothetical protein
MTGTHASNEQIKKEWAAQASSKEIADATKAGKEGIGHNSNPQVNPELQAAFREIHKHMDSRKAINDEIRGAIAIIKEKFGLPVGVVRRELALQRMDEAARAQLEQGLNDAKIMLGIDLFNWQEKIETENSDIEDPLAAAKAEQDTNKKLKTVK